MSATTEDFLRRTYRLLARGLRPDFASELRWCGNVGLVAEVERASDADIAALNAEWAARHP